MLPKEREHLVLDNLNLIHYILQKKFHRKPYSDEYEDLFQEGCIGLIISAIRFDESRGFKFSTYATVTVMGCISRYIRDKSHIIRVPRNSYDMIIKISKLSSQGFSLNEITEVTGYTMGNVQEVIQMTNLESLDKEITNDKGDSTTLHGAVSNHTNDYEELFSQDNIQQSIMRVSSQITNDVHRGIWEEYIWSMLYGEKLNQIYFASKYKISQSYVARILNKFKKMFVKELSK